MYVLHFQNNPIFLHVKAVRKEVLEVTVAHLKTLVRSARLICLKNNLMTAANQSAFLSE